MEDAALSITFDEEPRPFRGVVVQESEKVFYHLAVKPRHSSRGTSTSNVNRAGRPTTKKR